MSTSNHKEVIGEIREDLQEWAVVALNATQARALNFARSDEGPTQPGARVRRSKRGTSYYFYGPALPRRQAHPGLWADVTGLTVNSYGMDQPEVDGDKIVGSVFNTAPHADKLEGKRRKDGGVYWVLAGLVEDSVFASDFSIGRTFETEFNALVEND